MQFEKVSQLLFRFLKAVIVMIGLAELVTKL